MFLAFEEEDSLRKLILKKLPREDEVDETTKITLTSHNERYNLWLLNSLKIKFAFLKKL